MYLDLVHCFSPQTSPAVILGIFQVRMYYPSYSSYYLDLVGWNDLFLHATHVHASVLDIVSTTSKLWIVDILPPVYWAPPFLLIYPDTPS